MFKHGDILVDIYGNECMFLIYVNDLDELDCMVAGGLGGGYTPAMWHQSGRHVLTEVTRGTEEGFKRYATLKAGHDMLEFYKGYLYDLNIEPFIGNFDV